MSKTKTEVEKENSILARNTELKGLKESHDKIDKDFKDVLEKTEKKKTEDFLDKDKIEKLDSKLSEIEDGIKNLSLEMERKDLSDQLSIKEKEDYEKVFGTNYNGEKNSVEKEYTEAYDNYINSRSESVRHKSYNKLAELDNLIRSKPAENFFEKALQNSDLTQGGFAVPAHIEMKIRKNLYETSPVRMVADSKMTGSDRFVYYTDPEDTEVNHLDEETGSPGTETKAYTLKEHQINVHDYIAQPVISLKQLEDSFFNPEQYVNEKVLDKFKRVENRDFIRGDGKDRAQGLTSYVKTSGTYDETTEPLSIERVDFTGSLDYDDIISLEGALFTQYQMNAKFLVSRVTKTALRKLKDNQGQYLSAIGNWGGFMGVKGQNYLGLQLLGKPVLECNDLQDGTTTADIPIFYGDFKKCYCIVDRVGISQIRDNITSKGFVKYYTRRRLGAGVVLGQGIKALYKSS